MAYGDDIPQNPPVPWSGFEETEYLFRFEDLLNEFWTAFSIAHSDPDNPRADEADREWRRCQEKLEETAKAYAVYRKRLRLQSGGQRDSKF
jgi:hypothetical protein